MNAWLKRSKSSRAVALFVFGWLAATAWIRPLMLPDEGRYVGVAWEMLRSGDWLVPTLNGLPFFHKPPLMYWLTASSMSVFGVNEWAGRSAPIFGAWLAAMSIYGLLRRWASEREATLTLIALLSLPMMFLGSQYANLDMLVAGCISATIALLAHAALSFEAGLGYKRIVWAAYAAAACSVLAKGLIGLVLPMLVVGAWLTLRWRWRTVWALLSVPGALLFLLIAAPWFVAMQLRFDSFLDYFFVVHHFKRFTLGGFNNVMPVWFFLAVLILFSLPFVPWLVRLLLRLKSGQERGGALLGLLVLWLLLIVIFFSIPKSKLVGYVLPSLAPLAACFALGLGASPRVGALRMWWSSVALSVLMSVSALTAVQIKPLPSYKAFAQQMAHERQAGEPVFMLREFYYDVGFYARLEQSTAVVDNWDSPEVRDRDNWRKELIDAGDFDALAAKRVLVLPKDLQSRLCSAPISWVIGGENAAALLLPSFLTQPAKFQHRDGTRLWRVRREQLSC
jgi:4-amino-4-deoxy-L-arabinose transferase-like glycosyltransferase